MLQDISEGRDPVPGRYDAFYNQWHFYIAGETYTYPANRMPFTMIDAPEPAADRDLILAHSHKQAKRFYG